MNNKTNKKLLTLSIIFVLFWAAISIAYTDNNYITIKPVLNHAVQSIRSIVFNEKAIRDPENLDKEIVVESNHGNMMIRWRVLMAVEWTNNTLTTWSEWSSLFYWRDNYLGGTNSYIIAWDSNTITDDVSWSMIIGWTKNSIDLWSNNYVIWWSGNRIVNWNDDYIVWGHDNSITDSNYAYIIGWANSKIENGADHSMAAWSDIYIDKPYVFAWKDTSDDVVLNPKEEKTFTMFAMNWMTIGYGSIDASKEPIPWTVDVNWIFQVADEAKHCALNIAGAIQYTGWLYGCFCYCNGSKWTSLVPAKKCRNMCDSIDWPTTAKYNEWVCRYKKDEDTQKIPVIWSLDASQACDNWEAEAFTITSDWWSWRCVGNNWSGEECVAKRKVEEGKCSTNKNSTYASLGLADYNFKCDGWYAFEIKNAGNNIFTWKCKGINAGDSPTCKSCKNNWTYKTSPTASCVNNNWTCNDKFHKGKLGDLHEDSIASNNKGLCSIWTVANFTEKFEDWEIKGWTWECRRVSEDARDASCYATRKVTPGRCKATTVPDIHKYWECDRWEFTGVDINEENNTATWICAGINYLNGEDNGDKNCQWCRPGYKYNRNKQKCIPTNVCEYQTWLQHVDDTYVLSVCHEKLVLKDKNIWAENIWDVWYYFQWWNNHWFTAQELNNTSKLTWTRAEWSNAYLRKWYSWDHFIMQEDNEEECLYYNYWQPQYDSNGKKVCTIRRDLWWGRFDWTVQWNYHSQRWHDTLFTVHSDAITDLVSDYRNDPGIDISEYMLNSWALYRQGPCETGWHVPAGSEWGALLINWCTLNPDECINDITRKRSDHVSSLQKWWNLSSSTTAEGLWDKFSEEFSLPRGWIAMPSRYYQNRIISSWDASYYWTSSAESDTFILYLWSNRTEIYATKGQWEMRWWMPIRCFKNPEIIDDDVFVANLNLGY